MNRNEASVSPCRTPVTMSKKSVSPFGEGTFTFMIFWNIIMAVMVSLGSS